MPARVPGQLFARNLIERRSLIFQLVKRDFRQRYIGSAAGWLWGVIHPLVLLASYTFIFTICLGSKLEAGEVTTSYPMFLFAGILPWLLFSETVQRSATSVVEHASLVTKTVFPAEIVPVAIFLSTLISHLIALTLALLAASLWLGAAHNPWLLLLPFYLAAVGMFAIGIGWIVAALHVYIRDTAQIVTVLFTFWFWITPVMLPASRFPARVRWVLAYNPMAYAVTAWRQLLLGHGPPSVHGLQTLAWTGLATLLLGGLFFRRLKRGFGDVL